MKLYFLILIYIYTNLEINEYLIKENGIKDVEIGENYINTINEIKKKCLSCKFELDENIGFTVLENDSAKFSFWSKDKVDISGITFYSNKYITIHNIKIGDTISNVKKKYKIKIKTNEITEEKYFSINNKFVDNKIIFRYYIQDNKIWYIELYRW